MVHWSVKNSGGVLFILDWPRPIYELLFFSRLIQVKMELKPMAFIVLLKYKI